MFSHRAKLKPNEITKAVLVHACKINEYLLIVISCYFVPWTKDVHQWFYIALNRKCMETFFHLHL